MKTAAHDMHGEDHGPGSSGTVSEALWGFEEVAAFLKVPEATLRRWRFYGTGPTGVRIGRHVRYDPADVRAWWLAEKRQAVPRGRASGFDGR